VQPYYDFVVVMLCFPLLMYAALLSQPDPLTARICTFFGAISYAVYALHEPLSRPAGEDPIVTRAAPESSG
jgi:peptidoglycan/LPS O-acetylase OafA/YrhL